MRQCWVSYLLQSFSQLPMCLSFYWNVIASSKQPVSWRSPCSWWLDEQHRESTLDRCSRFLYRTANLLERSSLKNWKGFQYGLLKKSTNGYSVDFYFLLVLTPYLYARHPHEILLLSLSGSWINLSYACQKVLYAPVPSKQCFCLPQYWYGELVIFKSYMAELLYMSLDWQKVRRQW